MADVYLKQIQEVLRKIESNMVTKEDLAKALAKHPTKKDLKKALDDLAVEVTLNTDKHKAEKEELLKLEKRVGIIEDHLQISSL